MHGDPRAPTRGHLPEEVWALVCGHVRRFDLSDRIGALEAIRTVDREARVAASKAIGVERRALYAQAAMIREAAMADHLADWEASGEEEDPTDPGSDRWASYDPVRPEMMRLFGLRPTDTHTMTCGCHVFCCVHEPRWTDFYDCPWKDLFSAAVAKALLRPSSSAASGDGERG